ncbi:hypothetical protein ACFVVU_16400 [Kitasatospora sp. NPDC057965]|uniref:hypothetical protein n=1 Tax=Kitasatospora sp. NPDC057965 TaxID=3346291 RepID=UPI0036D90A7C
MAPVDHDVPALSARITAWLAAHTAWAPERPAADGAALDAFAARHRLELPADLRAWWRLPGVPADRKPDWEPAGA